MDTNVLAFMALCLSTAWESLTAMFAWLVANPLVLAGAAAAGLVFANIATLTRWFKPGN